ncbi:MAG: hypothetical protein U0K87_06060, partial [Ruminococcus sp.]|nr:hypothetical protein [Ruminococcus sp.]
MFGKYVCSRLYYFGYSFPLIIRATNSSYHNIKATAFTILEIAYPDVEHRYHYRRILDRRKSAHRHKKYKNKEKSKELPMVRAKIILSTFMTAA